LSDHRDLASQFYEGDCCDVDPIDQNLTASWFDQARESVHNRGLSRAVSANDAQKRLWLNLKADVFDDILLV